MNKENVVYAYNGKLFSLQRKESPHATTCINLEDIMLSEISQAKKDKYYIIPLKCGA